MTDREQYTPGPASGAQVQKDGQDEEVDAHPRPRTAPLAGKSLAGAHRPGASARVGALRDRWEPGYGWNGESHLGGSAHAARNKSDASRCSQRCWSTAISAGNSKPSAGGTRLTLWHKIDRRFISWGAAGWHICFDVLDRLLAGNPIGRIAGADAMKFDGWQRLTAEYAKQFGAGDAQASPGRAQNS